MHTAYPFNIKGERRSFSFNAKIILKKIIYNLYVDLDII